MMELHVSLGAAVQGTLCIEHFQLLDKVTSKPTVRIDRGWAIPPDELGDWASRGTKMHFADSAKANQADQASTAVESHRMPARASDTLLSCFDAEMKQVAGDRQDRAEGRHPGCTRLPSHRDRRRYRLLPTS